jgi:hypothetical protein
VTAERCINHGLDTNKKLRSAGGSILMCLLDFNQPVNMLVAGVSPGTWVFSATTGWTCPASYYMIAQRSLGLLNWSLM